ncbi:hypothetical protein R3W88_022555 [Solanum pinnatisectum]|uniref:Uncharacterized protein n=1 Tax=Solanum pinnatisectum TaxID=50273 RepID=A0AAV9LYW3_9SOLN|nr:hypothetical protein R3W88_022555 [Solanum pinnatisectum]
MGDDNTTRITTLVEEGDRDLAVVTQSGKVVVGDMKGNDEAQAHKEDKGIEEEEILIQQSITKESRKDVEKSNQLSKVVQPLPKIPPPFPQRLKQKNEDEKALTDVESGELKFRVNEDEVTFNVCKSMKHPRDIHVVLTIDVIDEAVASVSHLMCMSEPLEAVIANYDEFEVQGYDEVVAGLPGLGEHSKTSLKLDIDLKN